KPHTPSLSPTVGLGSLLIVRSNGKVLSVGVEEAASSRPSLAKNQRLGQYGSAPSRALQPKAPRRGPKGLALKPRTPTPGFRTTTRRLVLELSIVLSVMVLLGAGLWVGVRWAATKLAENLPLEADRALGQLAWKQLAPEDKRC